MESSDKPVFDPSILTSDADVIIDTLTPDQPDRVARLIEAMRSELQPETMAELEEL